MYIQIIDTTLIIIWMFMYRKKKSKKRNNIVVKPWFGRLKIGTPKVILKKEHPSVQWPKDAPQKDVFIPDKFTFPTRERLTSQLVFPRFFIFQIYIFCCNFGKSGRLLHLCVFCYVWRWLDDFQMRLHGGKIWTNFTHSANGLYVFLLPSLKLTANSPLKIGRLTQ